MARKTVLVCDNCGREVGEGKGATLRLNYTDARRGSKQADLCDNCAGQMPGHAAALRVAAQIRFCQPLLASLTGVGSADQARLRPPPRAADRLPASARVPNTVSRQRRVPRAKTRLTQVPSSA